MIGDDDEPFAFSYYQDISQNPEVIKLALGLIKPTRYTLSQTNI